MSSTSSLPSTSRDSPPHEFPTNSVYLVRDEERSTRGCPLPLRGACPWSSDHVTEFSGQTLTLHKDEAHFNYLSDSSPVFSPMAEYILQTAKWNKRFLTFDTQWVTPKGSFRLATAWGETFIKTIRKTLPSPFLEVTGAIHRNGPGQHFQFTQRILLGKKVKFFHPIPVVIPWGEVAQPMNDRASNSSYFFSMRVSIMLGWEDATVQPETGITVKHCPGSLLQTLFENEATKNMAIVVGSGVEIKCHKMIFSAHSPVLAAMLSPETGMREGQTGRMELVENSEDGIRHLLRYLYCIEVDMSGLTCEVAVELFRTAHKYELTQLEASLLELLLKKGSDWYEPDTLLELYYHAKNVRDLSKLQDHCLRTITRMTREIRSCEEFKKLDPDSAMELICKLFDNVEGTPR